MKFVAFLATTAMAMALSTTALGQSFPQSDEMADYSNWKVGRGSGPVAEVTSSNDFAYYSLRVEDQRSARMNGIRFLVIIEPQAEELTLPGRILNRDLRGAVGIEVDGRRFPAAYSKLSMNRRNLHIEFTFHPMNGPSQPNAAPTCRVIDAIRRGYEIRVFGPDAAGGLYSGRGSARAFENFPC